MGRAADPRRRGAQPFSSQWGTYDETRSPQARGSTGIGGRIVNAVDPIPAGAGLNRKLPSGDSVHSADPRRRGAQPKI